MECRKCDRDDLTQDDFYEKGSGRRDTTCKKCRIKTNSENSWRQLHTVNGKKRRNRLLIKELKSGPRMDCGHKFPSVCMDFDHRDPKQKVRGVTAMTGQTEKAILAEVAKCDLVCANCHRIRTARTRGYFL